jgi:Protein of unknown function (DUF3306)
MAEREEPGFLARWSQRKQAVREGQPVQEAVVPLKDGKKEEKWPLVGIKPAQSAPESIANQSLQTNDQTAESSQQALPPAPTLEDTQQLTPASDFKPFMRADVQPEVKNAAMKQLFKDPHFNTMDMMDVYVDDYSKPDPLPPEMLRKMAVTQFLGFWKEEEEEEEEKKKKEQAREDARPESAQSVAQSTTPKTLETSQEESDKPVSAMPETPVAQTSSQDHDHPDLRLQPDDAARRESDRQRAG